MNVAEMRLRAKHRTGCLHCIECGEPMFWIFCPSIRDTCAPCGGESKVVTEKDDRPFVRLPRRKLVRPPELEKHRIGGDAA